VPHGTPDWGLVGPKETLYGLDDLGEAAVRLGSVHMWDRRGDAILIDNFEHGLGQGLAMPGGLNAACVLEGGRAFHGAFSAKLTAGADGTHLCSFEYMHGLPVTSRLGLEFSFTVAEYTEAWVWYFEWRAGEDRWTAAVRYDHTNTLVEYLDVDGNYQLLDDDVCMEEGDTIWHTGKLVADFADRTYVRFIQDGQTWPLPHLVRYAAQEETCPYIRFVVIHEGVAGHNPSGYLDAVVITQNEP